MCGDFKLNAINKMRALPKGYSDWRSVYKRIESERFSGKKGVFLNEKYFTIGEIEQALINELLHESLLHRSSAGLIILAIDKSRSISGADTKAELKSSIRVLIVSFP